ncbi:MAG: alpha/beta hydrolase [Methanobacteriaceae archaeon]|jgi:pimeloyl-ACP methyl ester carboxylesterase|nr:alpha/beta hydrolase [Candidatus Methanorudis spinitermitis]
MKKVYKNKQGENALIDLYNNQLKSLNVSYEDLWIETRYGQAHIVKLGKSDGKPLLLFHGGNSTTPYYLKGFISFFKHFCIYAVDTVGHPGKSAQIVLSPKSIEYGQWASDVISGLGFQKMYCMGGSYGGGILVKLMCFSPEKIEKAVLIVPSAISNVSTFNVMIKMGIPMIFYILTKKDYWLKKAIIPMAIEENNIDKNTYQMVKSSFENAVVKVGMPSNAKTEELNKCIAPVFLIAAEKDCMFPGKKVIERAKKIIPNLKTHMLNNQGHLCVLPDDVLKMIIKFLDE